MVRRYTEGCESFGPLREGAQAITKAAKFLRDGESCRVVCTGTNGCGSLAASLSTLKESGLQLIAGKGDERFLLLAERVGYRGQDGCERYGADAVAH